MMRVLRKTLVTKLITSFLFIKPTHKEPTIEEEVVVSATVEEPAQANVASNNANHRSSRFSSFFQQPSNQPAKETNKSVSEETQKQLTLATIPPPGFSKFFGGQRVVHRHLNILRSHHC